MIKRSCGFVLLVLFGFQAKSQILIDLHKLKNIPFILGLEAGLNVSSLQLEKSNFDDNKQIPKFEIGYKAGISIVNKLNKSFDIETG